MTFTTQIYDGRKCFMECPPGPCHCRDAYRPVDPHPGGSLNTSPAIGYTTLVPIKPVIGSLDDDTPLVGGACDLGGDCESCQ